MGTYVEAYWRSDIWGGTRRQRASGAYSYYVPDLLDNMTFSLDEDVIGDVERAQRALYDLNGSVGYLHDTEGLARLLLRAEAVSSSYIEGLKIGTRKLLRSEMNDTGHYFKHNETASAVLGNIRAMQRAVDDSTSQERITVDTILTIHRELMRGTPLEEYGGIVRNEQNWVGGNSENPLSASYVPPAPHHVRPLLDDLADFANRRDIPGVLKAALVHAQFESIHPFVDGNGRTGRALIHAILKRDGLTDFVPPISLIMATHAKTYTEALNDFRFDGTMPGNGHDAINDWVSFFSGSALAACEEAHAFESDMADLVRSWRKRLGQVRANSSTELILDEIIGTPLFTVASMAESVGRSIPAISNAVIALEEAGVIREVSNKTRYRVFEAPDVIDQFNIFERRLASPVGDTKRAKPVRPVPDNLSIHSRSARPPSSPKREIAESRSRGKRDGEDNHPTSFRGAKR